ncbi:MAG: DNA polymerase III subunit gamma/tau [Microcoleaceae cyanobacterium]
MAYEPLHHKYRPQTFAQLVGQDAIAATLISALNTNRIAPAYLFTGPRGTGKTSSARILAKSLNCLKSDRPTEYPCGECEVCRGIVNGSALDVIEIDAASNTGVDNIRDLIERAQFAPVQCRYKVYVIDECHMLSTAAFNALLKTLEEPPDRIVFVLATTDLQRVLPTIISRCQKFDFCRIPLNPMINHLQDIAQKETIRITPEAIQMVAQIAQGGLRDAESLLDQLSLFEEEVTVEKVWDLVGIIPERDLMELLRVIASENPTAVLDCTRQLLDRGREPIVLLQNLAEFYRDLLIAKTAPSRGDLVRLTPPTWKELCDFSQVWETQIMLKGQQHLRSSEVQIKNTTQPRLWLEVTLLGLLPSSLVPVHSSVTAQPQALPVRPLPSRVQGSQVTGKPESEPFESQSGVESSLESKVQPQAQPQVQLQPTVPSPPEVKTSHPAVTAPWPTPESKFVQALDPTLTSEMEYDLESIWQQVLAQASSSLQTVLRLHGRLARFNGQVANIEIDDLQKIRMVRATKVEEAFQRALNCSVKVLLDVPDPKLTSKSTTQRVRESCPPSFVTPPEQSSERVEPSPTISPEQFSQSVEPSHTHPLPEQNPELNLHPNLQPEGKSLSMVLDPEVDPPSEQYSQSQLQADADVVAQAAQRLVAMFDGQIVDASGDVHTSDSPTTHLNFKPSTPSQKMTKSSNDDVPF